MTTTTKTAFSLNPVYMEVDQRGQDDKLVLVNADEIITHIVSPGHPNAAKLLADFSERAVAICNYNRTMPLEAAKLAALIEMIEGAYGIDNGVPADDIDDISEDEEDALTEKLMATLRVRMAASKR